VVELADGQHGVASLAQLGALGMSDRMVRGWVAAARLQRIHQGVYVVGHTALRREGHWLAAVLACGRDAVLSHHASAALQDLAAPREGRIDVTVPGRVGRTRRGIRVHSGNRLPSDERDIVAGIRCTSITRTIIDLAAVLTQRGVEQVCERAVRINAFDLYELNRLRARHRGRRGIARLGAVLAAWDDDLVRARSELEVLFLKLVIEAGIERPLVNRTIAIGGRTIEVDFHWPDARLVVETDGRAFHDNPLARRRDADRDQALAAAGWLVERFDWEDVTGHQRQALRVVSGSLGARSRRAA
jgi:very-short-patch-repair endonuclease